MMIKNSNQNLTKKVSLSIKDSKKPDFSDYKVLSNQIAKND
jgi:hypothetical protein